MKELDIYIAIEGPIGVGKTSLAELIADKLNARKVFEKFEENPFLKDFYDDPESTAFQTQIFFLLQRYQQQQKDIRQLNLLQKGVVTDYMFEKDRLFADFTLNSEAEFKLYSHVADILEKDIVKPDLVVYLQADTPRLMKNIKKRGRDFEKHVTQDFFKQVNDTYGHAGGDAVLIEFAKLLEAEITSPNIVGRIGGEEFLAILYLNQDQAAEFCRKLIIKINNNTVHFDGIDIKITSSGGVAFSSETETSADLTNKADERLYEAKKSGRNRFKLIDTELVGD